MKHDCILSMHPILGLGEDNGVWGFYNSISNLNTSFSRLCVPGSLEKLYGDIQLLPFAPC
ncbi:hypothetical protein ACJIZ3_013361 [Penstemon smallii]|uniref:Uncharacterized protein n=1 Tax=Penstemon smallii TaxID=265156 RepID=A0ABD3UPL5_9LAMI